MATETRKATRVDAVYCLEPLEGESKLAFERYRLFRDMPYHPLNKNRSLRWVSAVVKVQSLLKDTEDAFPLIPEFIPLDKIIEFNEENKKRTGGFTWNAHKNLRDQETKYKWRDRCRHFDIMKSRDLEVERGISERKVRKEYADLSHDMLKRAKEILAMPLYKKTLSEDGQTIIIKPVNVKASDAAILGREAKDLATFGYNIRERKISELEAIECLVKAGYIPQETYNIISEGLDQMQEAIADSLSNFTPIEDYETDNAEEDNGTGSDEPDSEGGESSSNNVDSSEE